MIPFGDLKREYDELSSEIDPAIKGVCQKGWFVLGENVDAFESAFAAYIGGGVNGVAVGSGTEALHLSLVAAGVEHGDYVITVPNTAVPTVSAITFAGAVPIFVDVDETSLNIDPTLLRETAAREKARLGKRLKAVVPVHLYGQSADMGPIKDVAEEFGLKVVEDACQAHGAEYKGTKAGSIGDYAAFSFYPSKNLGAYGDGGMVLTRDRSEAAKLKMLRNYGQEKRYHHRIKGFNSRLDEVQAAVLLVKLKRLDMWNKRRREIAELYGRLISNPVVTKPSEMPYGRGVDHLYVIRHKERDALQACLKAGGVDTLIHYPMPVHMQPAYADLGLGKGEFPVAEKAAGEILSLPMFPQLRDDEVEKVAELINAFER